MFSLKRPLGRLPFLLAVTSVNLALVLALTVALTVRPSGPGHLAVVIVVAALQFCWMSLHARRFADAGRGATAPVLMFLLGFAVFVAGYLVFAALWSSAEVQREAFRTAGGFGGTGLPLHVETNPLVIETGRVIASWLGAAGAVVLSGMILVGFFATGLLAGGFTIFSLFLPSKPYSLTNLSGQKQFKPV